MTLPNYDEAKLYLGDPHTCFQLQTVTKHISLLPRNIGCLKVGIYELLDAELEQFSDELDGVLVAYTNVRRLQPGGMVFEEMCHLHFDIQVDVIVFKPTIGCTLKAEVNKLTNTYVGCLVHNCFNASISKPENVDSEDWEGSKLTLGQVFQFQVTEICCQNGLIFIRGNIPYGSLTSDVPKQKKKKKRKLSDCSDEEMDQNDRAIHKRHKSKKSKNDRATHKRHKSKKSRDHSIYKSPDNTKDFADCLSTENECDLSVVKKNKSKKKKLRDLRGFDSPRRLQDNYTSGVLDNVLDVSMDALSQEASELIASVIPNHDYKLSPGGQSPEAGLDQSGVHTPMLGQLPQEWPSVGSDSGVSSIQSGNCTAVSVLSPKKSKKHKEKTSSMVLMDSLPKKQKKKEIKKENDSDVLICNDPGLSTRQIIDDSIFSNLSVDVQTFGGKPHKQKRKHKMKVKSFM